MSEKSVVFDVKQLAEYLMLNEKTVYYLTQQGNLPGFKVGGSWRYKKEDIEKWIEEQKNKAVPEITRKASQA